MTCPAEGKVPSSSCRLDLLYHACINDYKLSIQPPILYDTDDIPGSPGSFMENFVDPDTGVMCHLSVEVQPPDGDVNTGNHHLYDPMMAAAAYGKNMQNLVRGCEREALSSAMDPTINIFTNQKFVVDHGSDDSIIDTSQNDMLLGGRFYPISTEGVVASGNCQTIRHDQNEQKSCCYMLSDDFMCTPLGSPQHTANQGRGWAPTNGAPDVTYGILDCSGPITNVLVGTHV